MKKQMASFKDTEQLLVFERELKPFQGRYSIFSTRFVNTERGCYLQQRDVPGRSRLSQLYVAVPSKAGVLSIALPLTLKT